ncbi:MAG: FxsA family protein [Thiobacillaceae bacterium]
MRTWFVMIIALGFPALELVGIYLIWQRIGVATLFWLATAAVVGIRLLRREHLDFMPRLAQSVMDGHTPLAVMLASFRRVLAGLLLVFPGMGSDVLALILLLWPGGRPPRRPPTQASTRQGETVIEGEYRRLD